MVKDWEVTEKMTVYRKVWSASLLVMVSCFFLVVGTAHAMPDVVAKVGSIAVTKYELQRRVQKILPLQGGFHSGVPRERLDEIQESALNDLVEQAYKVVYALTEEVAVDNASVEKGMEALKARYKSEQEFLKASGGETMGAYRASIYRELLAKAAEKVAVDDKVNISDAQVKAYYDANKSTFERPKQFKASHILIKVDPSSNQEEREALKKRADELFERAKAGEDFYDLAYYNSDDRTKYVGGDLGYFHEGQTVKEFESAILKMKAGDISGPVKTMHGYHIIKMVEVNEPRQLEFDEVKGKIRASLEEKQRKSIYESWMGDLKKRYKAQRFDK